MAGMNTRKAAALMALVVMLSSAFLLLAPAAQAGTSITVFNLPTADAEPVGITSGPDGNLWICEYDNGAIAKMKTSGETIAEYPLPAGREPVCITAGPDGTLWFTEYAPAPLRNRIGRITTAGTVTEYDVPTLGAQVIGITSGPDGALWFTERGAGKIGRCTTTGTITEFNLPAADSRPQHITTGPDGALWFTEHDANAIGRMTTSGNTQEFPLPHANSGPTGITMGVDGNLWFTELGGQRLGRMTPSGSVKEYDTGLLMMNITSGPDGALWFGGQNASGTEHFVCRSTVSGVITDYAVPETMTFPNQLTTGSDGNVWFTGVEESGNQVGRVTGYPTDTWYLAEGTTAWGFDQYISIANPNASAATAVITYMTDDGAVDGGTVPLPAGSQATVNPRETLGDRDFSTMVVCPQAKSIAVDRTMEWTGTGAASQEGHACVGVTMPSRTWYLAEGSSEWGFECWLLIQNPTSVEATCDVTYMIEGSGPQTVQKTVPANSRKSFDMADDIGARTPPSK